MSDSRASLLINGLGGGVLSCVLFNNALATVQTSRRRRRERRTRAKPLLSSWLSLDMDTADAIGFYGAGDGEERRGETRSRAFGAKGVARAFAFLYPLSLVGRLVKRKVSRAAHRVADHAADRVAERAARILRDERVAEEQAKLALAAAARADPLEALEEEQDPKDESPGEDSAAEVAADDAADDAATADVALQCEMEEGAKTPTTLSDAKAKATTEREEDALGASPATPERTTSAPRTLNLAALSPPPSGWDLVSEDGE